MKAKTLLCVLGIGLLGALLSGCGSTNPVSTGFSDEGGYSINLGAPSGSLPYGGEMVLTGTIRDASGKTVDYSPYPVTFTSEAGGEFAPIQAQIASGVVTTVYVAPKMTVPGSVRAATTDVPETPTIDTLPTPTAISTDLPMTETVTMNFRGAAAKLRFTLFKP